jgi:hypothetical protein
MPFVGGWECVGANHEFGLEGRKLVGRHGTYVAECAVGCRRQSSW